MILLTHMREKCYNLIERCPKIAKIEKEKKMDEIVFKKSLIISRQILLYFVDFYKTVLPLFDKTHIYRVPIVEYNKFRENDKLKFSQDLYRLKQEGFIRDYYNEKEHLIELTNKGKKKLRKIIIDQIDFKPSKSWDKKWRVVTFDVPNTKSSERDILRHKLESIGFFQLQKSVYIYPYECFKEIKLLKDLYYLSPHVQYMVVDRLETEVDLIKKFTDWGILKLNQK